MFKLSVLFLTFFVSASCVNPAKIPGIDTHIVFMFNDVPLKHKRAYLFFDKTALVYFVIKCEPDKINTYPKMSDMLHANEILPFHVARQIFRDLRYQKSCYGYHKKHFNQTFYK